MGVVFVFFPILTLHQYTVTMFLVDTSPSMGKTREVEIPGTNGSDSEVIEMTNLEWSLQYVMLKIQEMVRRCRSV